MNRQSTGRVFWLVTILLLVASAVSAQKAGTGTLTGTVTDESGAAVAKATVVVTNTANSQAKTVTAAADGGYKISLPPGTYTVAIGYFGYKTLEVPSVKVAAGEMPVVNGKLVATVTYTSPPSAAPQVIQSAMEWQHKHDMALKYPTLWDFYMGLKKAADKSAHAAVPDWSGVWTAAGARGGGFFGTSVAGVSPKLTPTTSVTVKEGQERTAKGLNYDNNLSPNNCGPAGYPRWEQEPLLREFIPTAKETWLINELVNETRRIYTDGRGHIPEQDRYPLVDGDSIGFWDGQKLVIHTTSLEARPMGGNQPRQSEKMETVEIWQKVNADTMLADQWVFDPTLYLEPWYVQRQYKKFSDPTMRVDYWDCTENSNNDVIKTPEGGTDYKAFQFQKQSDDKSNH